jgi:hypothetical protein
MSRPVGAGNLLAAAEYVHANGPWTNPDNYNKGNLVLNYSQGNPDNGFWFTGMYMNDAFHATSQIPQRAVTEELICLYCPFDPDRRRQLGALQLFHQICRDDRYRWYRATSAPRWCYRCVVTLNHCPREPAPAVGHPISNTTGTCFYNSIEDCAQYQ